MEPAMTPDLDPALDPAEPALSPTGQLLEALQLYGARPAADELDPRPMPEVRLMVGAAADLFDALVATFTDTCLEPDLEELLWGAVNLFQRAVERLERQLDDNERTQQRLQREQDGSEVRSVELERALALGLDLIERRDGLEAFRDAAADQFQVHTGHGWTPRSGSKVNHKALTSAVVESRDFLNARRWTDQQVLIPPGVRIAFSGGTDFNDHRLIWEVLDKVRAKHPQMVLLHGGSKTGAERIASCWALARQTPQVPFPPNFPLHGRSAAPFKRNDAMLEALPIGVIVFPGGGIQGNLADKAKAMGLRLMDYRGR
jgi:YspA, cpYpsA-related SLOG family